MASIVFDTSGAMAAEARGEPEAIATPARAGLKAMRTADCAIHSALATATGAVFGEALGGMEKVQQQFRQQHQHQNTQAQYLKNLSQQQQGLYWNTQWQSTQQTWQQSWQHSWQQNGQQKWQQMPSTPNKEDLLQEVLQLL